MRWTAEDGDITVPVSAVSTRMVLSGASPGEFWLAMLPPGAEACRLMLEV